MATVPSRLPLSIWLTQGLLTPDAAASCSCVMARYSRQARTGRTPSAIAIATACG